MYRMHSSQSTSCLKHANLISHAPFLSVFLMTKPTITMTVNMRVSLFRHHVTKSSSVLWLIQKCRVPWSSDGKVFSDGTWCCLINRGRVRCHGSHVCTQLAYRLQYDRRGVSRHRWLQGPNMPAGESSFSLTMWAPVLPQYINFIPVKASSSMHFLTLYPISNT